MHSYIALLRGINVSGQKKILMPELKAVLGELDLENIQTYIQSGNIVFRSANTDPRSMANGIELKILDRFGFEVPVRVLHIKDFRHILDRNPFPGIYPGRENAFYVTFLFDNPSPELLDKLKEADVRDEQYKIDGEFIYMCFHKSYGKAKMNNNFIEKKLKLRATTRNWKTVNTLYEMAISI